MLKLRALSPQLQAHAYRELNEDPKRRAADIAHIREWLKKQPHIIGDPDDQTIIAFLRGCKFSLERTKEKLDNYFTLRTTLPEFFKDANLSNKKLLKIHNLELYAVLPELDDEGRRVFMVRPGATVTHLHLIEDQFKLLFMMLDMMLREDDHMTVKGIVTLFDMGNVTLVHGAQMTPSIVKKLMTCAQDAFPLQIKAIDFFNTPPLFDSFFNLFTSFSNAEMQTRFSVHGNNMESLNKNIPKRILPMEYGGGAGSIKQIKSAWHAQFETYRNWFLANTSGVDESKRPPGSRNPAVELFGLQGSFRQLEFD